MNYVSIYSLQVFDTESELQNSSDHNEGDIAFNKDNNALYVFVDGSWRQTCGCDDNSVKRKRDVVVEEEEGNEMMKSEGTISRLWSGLKSWLGQEKTNHGRNDVDNR